MKKCAEIALDISTYYAGKNQATHPNVISFKEPWHGYRYWMAYTTYPYAQGSEENPCIAVSNDLLNWEKPAGLINPIACCEETECDELKDTHLLYREDLDRLELWYEGRIASTMQAGGPLFCFRKTSDDGVHWTKWEIVYNFRGGRQNLASPSVIWDNGYHFWGIRHNEDDVGLYYMFSPDGLSWTDMERCSVPQARETDMWHGTVTYWEGAFYFVWVGLHGEHRQRIYMATSSDGREYGDFKEIVQNDTGWAFLYRPALLLEKNRLSCFYGVVRCDGRWLIAASMGDSVDHLCGITAQQVQSSEERVATTRKLRAQNIKKVKNYFILRLLLLTPLSLLLFVFLDSALLAWAVSVIMAALASRFCFHDRRAFLTGLISGTADACIAVFLAQIVEELVSLF